MSETDKPKGYTKGPDVGFWLGPDNWVDIPRIPIDLAHKKIPGPIEMPDGTVRNIVLKGTPYEDV